MRDDFDSYIVFSPVKYFKTSNIIPKKMVKGYIFNRHHFHATPSTISCVLWSNINSSDSSWTLETYDIDTNNQLVRYNNIIIKQVIAAYNVFNDKRTFSDDVQSNVFVEYSTGMPSSKVCKKHSIFNDNIVGYLRVTSFNLDSLSGCLTRTITYDALTQSYGFYLRKDVYLHKLPLWCAKMFPQNNWFDKDLYFTTSDAGEAYVKDKDFLKSCLIYTCLSSRNRCITFDGSDDKHYQNELCFDDGTVASTDLATMELDTEEQKLIELWYKILAQARATNHCNANYTYGVYQITKEIVEQYTHEEVDAKGKTIQVTNYPRLAGDLNTLRALLKNYYKSHITDKMFQYELLK
jgi:hypothetical protein